MYCIHHVGHSSLTQRVVVYLESLQGCKTHCKVIITLDNAADQHKVLAVSYRDKTVAVSCQKIALPNLSPNYIRDGH